MKVSCQMSMSLIFDVTPLGQHVMISMADCLCVPDVTLFLCDTAAKTPLTAVFQISKTYFISSGTRFDPPERLDQQASTPSVFSPLDRYMRPSGQPSYLYKVSIIYHRRV